MSVSDRNFMSEWRRTEVKRRTEACTIGALDTVNLITNGTYAITLPSVSDAAGKMYSFCQDGTGTNSVTIADGGDDPNWTDVVINAQWEKALLYCDGIRWYMLVGQTS